MDTNNESKISNTEWGLVIGALGLIDLIQWGLILLFGSGLFVNWLRDIFVALCYGLYMILRGLLNWKYLIGWIISAIGTTGSDGILPLWILEGFYNFALYKGEQKLAKIPGGTIVAGMIAGKMRGQQNLNRNNGPQTPPPQSSNRPVPFKNYKEETKKNYGAGFQERPVGASVARAGNPFDGQHNITGNDRDRFIQAPEGKRKTKNEKEDPFEGHDVTGTDEIMGKRKEGFERKKYEDVISRNNSQKAA